MSNTVKDKILDVLLRSGAVVKQTYDYRVSLRFILSPSRYVAFSATAMSENHTTPPSVDDHLLTAFSLAASRVETRN